MPGRRRDDVSQLDREPSDGEALEATFTSNAEPRDVARAGEKLHTSLHGPSSRRSASKTYDYYGEDLHGDDSWRIGRKNADADSGEPPSDDDSGQE